MKELNHKDPQLSVIVPVYNVEKYLEKCLDSILAQTYQDFELIIVNDGSPDNSEAIIQRYAAKDNRIVSLKKENGGLSSARNAGIDVARGEFIAFIDSDDWIDATMFEEMVGKLVETDSDIVFCDVRMEYEDGSLRTEYNQTENFPEIIEVEEHPRLFLEVECFAWNKICRKSLFTDNNIRFPEGLLYEDIATFPRVYVKASRLVGVPKQFYHYIVREGAITQTFSIRGLDYLEVVKVVEIFFKQEDAWEKYKSIVYEFYLYHIFYSLSIYCAHIPQKEQRREAFSRVRESLREHEVTLKKIKSTKRNGHFLWQQRSLGKRIYYTLFWFAPGLLTFSLNLYHEVRNK